MSSSKKTIDGLSPVVSGGSVYYNDAITPKYGSTNVQGVLDNIKNNGLETNGFIATAGRIYCGDRIFLTAGLNGNSLMQMYSDGSGNIYWDNGSGANNQIA